MLSAGTAEEIVMAGLVPAIHDFQQSRTWMPATSAGMTKEGI
jgi:hypothetical protein